MNSSRGLLILLAGAMLSVVLCLPVHAQPQPAATDTQTQTPSQNPVPPNPPASAKEDKDWHVDLSPYLWFAGAHGTVGALGHDASVHASAGDLLSHFDFGLMGAAEARRKRVVLTGDALWLRVSDSKAVPFAGLGATSADVRLGTFIWTSKVGYRLVDNEKFKVDALVGLRFWHIGQSLHFNPSFLGINFNGSHNWPDMVFGGRVRAPVGKRVSVEALGDVGGWGETARLDYQFATLLGYKLSSRWTLAAGYRYLFIDYRSGFNGVINMVMTGPLVGATYRFK